MDIGGIYYLKKYFYETEPPIKISSVKTETYIKTKEEGDKIKPKAEPTLFFYEQYLSDQDEKYFLVGTVAFIVLILILKK